MAVRLLLRLTAAPLTDDPTFDGPKRFHGSSERGTGGRIELNNAGMGTGGVVGVLVLGAHDWQLWRRLRRAALAEAPTVFGSTLADWSGPGDTEERWRGRLDGVGLNLVLTLDGEPTGMVSATAPGADGAVQLISLWVSPAGRGRGVGDEAVGQVVAWAHREHPGVPVTLSVRIDNHHARRLYERHGFVDAGPSPDGPDERRMRRRS
jgi:ribosomal protein S18 acetylase RimI-like enzyme